MQVKVRARVPCVFCARALQAWSVVFALCAHACKLAALMLKVTPFQQKYARNQGDPCNTSEHSMVTARLRAYVCVRACARDARSKKPMPEPRCHRGAFVRACVSARERKYVQVSM